MSKNDLVKLIRQWREEMQRLLDSMPEYKREESQRQEEVDIPEFMKDREKRIRECFKGKQYF